MCVRACVRASGGACGWVSVIAIDKLFFFKTARYDECLFMSHTRFVNWPECVMVLL